MFNKIFFYASTILFYQLINAQVNFDDLNTEFSNLALSVGYGYNSPSIYTSTLRKNIDEADVRHCLIKNNFYDENTNSLLRTCPVGEQFSFRLGNSNNDSQSEKMSFTFKINSDNIKGLLYYKYALVLQKSLIDTLYTHQSKFRVLIYLNNELLVEPIEINANSNSQKLNTFEQQPNRHIKWKDWSVEYIDLSKFSINDQLRIDFETYDCAVGQSFGYAYLFPGYLDEAIKSY